MTARQSTVAGRWSHAVGTLTPVQTAIAVGIVAALGFTLLFAQDPLIHDAAHNFRHGTGITCH